MKEMAEYLVEGYKTPYKSIVKARAAAWRMYQQKKSGRGAEVKILMKIAPHVYSEIATVTTHPVLVGATGYYCTDLGKWMCVSMNGSLFLR